MTENKKPIPEITENKPLADEQLEEVTGGWSFENRLENHALQNRVVRRCAANPEHTYKIYHDACPYCGCKESTIV